MTWTEMSYIRDQYSKNIRNNIFSLKSEAKKYEFSAYSGKTVFF